MKKKVLFYRDFKGFTGGHLKVWDYFQHVNSSDQFQAEIFMTQESTWKNNPWKTIKKQCLTEWNPANSDVLFLAGMDWLALSEKQRRTPPAPVINFIQGIRHADKNNPLYDFLKYPALRICVSHEVSEALLSTGKVNGAIHTNTNGINLTDFPPLAKKDIPLLIVGSKSPKLAFNLSKELSTLGIDHQLITNYIPRKDFLDKLNRASMAILLPQKKEGFYLPALEAMALKTLVICPDCIGNRSFCLDSFTCFMPHYSLKEIMRAILNAFSISKIQKLTLINNGYAMAMNNSIEKERTIFLEILSKVIDQG